MPIKLTKMVRCKTVIYVSSVDQPEKKCYKKRGENSQKGCQRVSAYYNIDDFWRSLV